MKLLISHKLLRQLRNNLGITIEQAASNLGVSSNELAKWESFDPSLSIERIQQLSKMYNRNWMGLLLEVPPSKPKVPRDFRKTPDAKGSFSPATLIAFEEAQHLLVLARDIHDPNITKQFLESERLSLRGDTDKQAERLREVLGVSLAEQLNFKHYTESLNHWVGALNAKGIYTIELDFPHEEARAFSLEEDGHYVIAINKHDEISARTFSLFHELAHVLLGKTGVCDLHTFRTNDRDTIEPYCNGFAASLLVPLDDIRKRAKALGEINESAVKDLAEVYKVSREVIYRRLYTLEIIGREEYSRARAMLQAQYKKKSKGGFQLYGTKVLRRTSTGFAHDVFDAYEVGRIGYRDIAKYLNISVASIPHVRDELRNATG